MPETPDLGDAIQSLLSDPNAGEQLSRALSALTGGSGGTAPGDSPAPPNPSVPFDMDKLLKFKKAFDIMKNGRDERIDLLLALRPFLSADAAESVDMLIKMLRLLKLSPLLRELDLKSLLS